MNEDLRPCLDIESLWEVAGDISKPDFPIYRHKDCPHLYRLIDFKKEKIDFHDVLYVKPEGVIDINRKLSLKEKAEIMGLILGIMHELKPITLPYVPETHKVYVQHEKNALGILYFMDTDKERSMVPIKRFFAIKRDPVLNFEEISWAKFREIAEVEDGNDK